MRISYLAATALALCLSPVGANAQASCSTANCSKSTSITYGSGTYSSNAASASYGQSSYGETSSDYQSSGSYGAGSYGSGSYGSSSHTVPSTRYSSSYGSSSSTHRAPCPSGSSLSSDGICLVDGGGYTSSSSSVGYTSPPSMTSATSSSSFSTNTTTVVPFATTVDNISNYRINGMGSDEYLSATDCPTEVYNPEGAKVLGCYSVVKPAPAPVYRPAPVIVPQVQYQQVRVVRPIIYVRYPVPTPVPVPVYAPRPVPVTGGCGLAYSRYGNNWPRMGGGCGGW